MMKGWLCCLWVVVFCLGVGACGWNGGGGVLVRADAPYWVQKKSGKTHNRGCRYYGRCKGFPAEMPTGNDCMICGGASRG